MRGGRTVKISIYDVVSDVIPLRIGDQVPADGVLISGHSLSIDESSMTSESKIVHKDQKAPFLMSGCKVADGVGSMLVIDVGINTEWGLLMARISEDTGEETPLQEDCFFFLIKEKSSSSVDCEWIYSSNNFENLKGHGET